MSQADGHISQRLGDTQSIALLAYFYFSSVSLSVV
jgi:hypothetical protein